MQTGKASSVRNASLDTCNTINLKTVSMSPAELHSTLSCLSAGARYKRGIFMNLTNCQYFTPSSKRTSASRDAYILVVQMAGSPGRLYSTRPFYMIVSLHPFSWLPNLKTLGTQVYHPSSLARKTGRTWLQFNALFVTVLS